MADKYIAVTIGPIFDTINLASSPSALWAASYLFSMLSKNICQTLTENGINKEKIISPYYDPDDELLNKNDGVGLFHDRIIFRADDFSIDDFNEKIKDAAIKKTLDLLMLIVGTVYTRILQYRFRLGPPFTHITTLSTILCR